MHIAVLIPCYNEGLTINKVVNDFRKILPQVTIYVYNNNSTDNTEQEAVNAGAIVRKETEQGKGIVVLRMFRDIDADYYLMVDGDDTYPAESALEMIDTIIKEDADMVIGDRLSNKTYLNENKRPFHNFGNLLVKKLINRFFNSKLSDIFSGYRLFSRRFVKNYSSMISGFELETDLSVYCLNYGFKIREVQVQYRDRPIGSVSKLNTIKDGYKVVRLFFNLYRLYKPLSFFSFISFILLIIGFALGILPIMDYIEYSYVYRVPTAIAAVSITIIAVLLFTCGLILDNISKFDKKNFKHTLLNYDENQKNKRSKTVDYP